MREKLLLFVLLIVTGAFMYAQKAQPHIIVYPDQLKWGPPPPTLPPGAQLAVLAGDPNKAGMFTLRLKAPGGYKVAPHWHPTDEHLTVLQGTFGIGMGDKLDQAKGQELPAGAYLRMPAKMHHYAWTKGETVIQVSAMGPFKIFYLNAADDPSHPTAAAAKGKAGKSRPSYR